MDGFTCGYFRHCLFNVSTIRKIEHVPRYVVEATKEIRGHIEDINFYTIENIHGKKYFTYWKRGSDITDSILGQPSSLSYFIEAIRERPINYPKKELA